MTNVSNDIVYIGYFVHYCFQIVTCNVKMQNDANIFQFFRMIYYCKKIPYWFASPMLYQQSYEVRTARIRDISELSLVPRTHLVEYWTSK
jgi:hypothetical protein